METDDNGVPETDQKEALKFGAKTKAVLAEIGKWGKFVSIVGFVLAGLMVMVGLALVFSGDMISAKLTEMGQPAGIVSPASGIAYMLIGVLYFFPSRYIYDFSIYMQQAVAHDDQESMDYSFDRLKTFFRFLGIIAIIAMVFYAFAFMLSLIGGIAG